MQDQFGHTLGGATEYIQPAHGIGEVIVAAREGKRAAEEDAQSHNLRVDRGNGKLVEVLGVFFPQGVGEETVLDGVQVAGLGMGLLTQIGTAGDMGRRAGGGGRSRAWR